MALWSRKAVCLDDILVLAEVVAGAFIIFGTPRMNVEEQESQIGALRAIGVSGRQIRRLVVLEAVFLGLIALAVGLAVGLPLSNSVVVIYRAGLDIVGLSLPGRPGRAAENHRGLRRD